MEQTTTQLSARSRITSSSNSFHPSTDSSTRTSCTMESARPPAQISSNSSRFHATPPPWPPRVKEGRTTQGRPTSPRTLRASSRLRATPERGRSSPTAFIASLNSSRSSARRMTSTRAPSSSTPYFSSAPRSATCTATLSPVCPPRVGRIASGRSFSRMPMTASGVTGSR